jgi:hypothetical protein
VSDVPELVGGEGELPKEDLLAEELLAEAGQLVPRQPDLLQLTVPGYPSKLLFRITACI